MNQTVLITGASRGIGAATARHFAQQGWNVVIGYNRSEKEAKALEREINAKEPLALALRADVADSGEVRELVELACGRFGRIDALVNNAGIAAQSTLLDTTEEQWDEIFDTDVKGMYHCARAVLPGMIDRRQGSIVNVSSIWGITGASCEVAYSAAKAAVIGFTKALAKELGPSGIRVNCVAPGVIGTDMMNGFDAEAVRDLCDQTALGRIGTPEDVAHSIFFFTSQPASFITGQVLSQNGGFLI